ncbi:MAG: hypothetical protein KKE57_07165 [Proteobacteria bacterium]|nr:hypothetical protein [Pseudomonadota bacterium]
MKRFMWLILLFVTACAPFNRIEGGPQSGLRSFSVELPQLWRELDNPKYLILTKDGPFSQYILVQQRPMAQPFKNTKRKLNKGMLPQEAAEVILDEIVSDHALLNFRLIENHPAIVNQYEGFRLVFSHNTAGGSSFKTIYYGLLRGGWFYSIRYCASEGNYSDRDVKTFEKVLHSFYITDAESA